MLVHPRYSRTVRLRNKRIQKRITSYLQFQQLPAHSHPPAITAYHQPSLLPSTSLFPDLLELEQRVVEPRRSEVLRVQADLAVPGPQNYGFFGFGPPVRCCLRRWTRGEVLIRTCGVRSDDTWIDPWIDVGSSVNDGFNFPQSNPPGGRGQFGSTWPRGLEQLRGGLGPSDTRVLGSLDGRGGCR